MRNARASHLARTLLAALAALVALAAPRRSAAVSQPDGTQIPAGPQLQQLFTARAERIDALADASLEPQRFVPGCRLTFTLVTRGPAQFRNAFGWYNATGSAPAEADLHVLLPCDAAPGTAAVLDLSREPAYRGGEIGFFLRTPQAAGGAGCTAGDCCARVGHGGYTYFTERRFNPDNTGANAYIHLLTYDSRATARAFYFAWEDLYGGGDNQFTDFVALVDQIVCAGAGGACDTGQRGVCAQGTRQCRNGELACVPAVSPSPERCDGLDNNCDGAVDEETADARLCERGFVCDRGVCVIECLEGNCPEGFLCSRAGRCVERECLERSCDAGQTCRAGRCVGACEGVTCPRGQACRAGRCVDPCEGVRCEADQVCAAGVCETRCACRRCGAGERCAASGRCEPEACADRTCPAGQGCSAGACVDACEGAVCPFGEACRAGRCEGVARDAGSVVVELGAVEPGFVAEPPSSDAGFDGALDGGAGPVNRFACGCRVAGSRAAASTARGPWALLAVATLAGLARAPRRRARSRAAR